MKSLFQSKTLHLMSCVLLFWKGISIMLWLLLEELGLIGMRGDFFLSTGFASAFALTAAAALSESRIFLLILLAVMGAAFLTFWVFFVLLAINRSGAGLASVLLAVLCVLDLPITVVCSFSQWWSISVCVVFHAAVFITVAMLRRSRAGAALVLSKMPESI